MLAYDLLFFVARTVVFEHPRAHILDPALTHRSYEVRVVGPGVLAVVLRWLRGVIGVGMVEAEQVEVQLRGPLLELLYLRRLDEEASRALLLVGVLGAPDVYHDLHLAHVHPDERPRALLGIDFSNVFVDVADVPPADLERQSLVLLPETLREVPVRPVAQDGDDDARLDLLRYLERRRDRSARGDADQNPLLARHALDHLVGHLRRSVPVLVCYRGVVDGGNDRALHVLHALQPVERRLGLERDYPYLGVVLLETARSADEGAAGAEAGYEVRDLTARLLPDLLRRRLVVRSRIGRLGVLVRVEVSPRLLRKEPPRLPDGPVRSLARVGQDKVNPVGAQYLLALLARVLRHAKPDPVTQSSPDPGVGDPRVPARRIQDGLLWRQSAAPLAVTDHPQGRAVLDRSTGVVPLGLAEYAYP